jgi:hypothetical protein
VKKERKKAILRIYKIVATEFAFGRDPHPELVEYVKRASNNADAALPSLREEHLPVRSTPNAFFKSPPWIQLRYAALEKYGARCMCCGATRKSGARLHVDHIKPRSRYPELALEISNLQILCEPCNLGKSNIGEKDWRTPRETRAN